MSGKKVSGGQNQYLKKREETLAAAYNPSIYENFIVLVKNESQLRGQGTDEVELFLAVALRSIHGIG